MNRYQHTFVLYPKKNAPHFHKNYKAAHLLQDQHIRMVSNGSWDTEDWSNDAENTNVAWQE